MLLHDNGRHGGGTEADKKFAKVSDKLILVSDAASTCRYVWFAGASQVPETVMLLPASEQSSRREPNHAACTPLEVTRPFQPRSYPNLRMRVCDRGLSSLEHRQQRHIGSRDAGTAQLLCSRKKICAQHDWLCAYASAS